MGTVKLFSILQLHGAGRTEVRTQRKKSPTKWETRFLDILKPPAIELRSFGDILPHLNGLLLLGGT
jgi:hypothetical protein